MKRQITITIKEAAPKQLKHVQRCRIISKEPKEAYCAAGMYNYLTTDVVCVCVCLFVLQAKS